MTSCPWPAPSPPSRPQHYPLHKGRGWTYRVSVVDLLHLPLAFPSVGQQGDGPIRAPAGQDQAVVVGCPAHRVHCRREGGAAEQGKQARRRRLSVSEICSFTTVLR